MVIEDVRVDLAERSHWNLGYFVAGMCLWLAILYTNLVLPLETARILWIVMSFGVFPVAVLVSRLINADPLSNSNELGRLVGYSHMSVVALSFPILVVTAIYDPHIQLLATAILYCIDFYVMSWAFGSSIFGIHAAVRMVSVTSVWALFPEMRLILIPILVAILYLLTVIGIPIFRRDWLTSHRAKQNTV